MRRLRAAALMLMACTLSFASNSDHPIDRAFIRLYNFDFPGTYRIIEPYVAAEPGDPLGYMVVASAVLFEELHGLKILEAEFFSEDKKIASKRKVIPDAARRQRFYAAIDEGKRRAEALLARNPNDPNALFSLALASGLTADYLALVEKKQLASLSHAKQSNAFAQKLLREDPAFADAYLTTGFSEYLLGSLPFFLRWFIKFEGIEGNKDRAVSKLERVVRSGRYLGPFAKILLAVYYIREKKPHKTRELLSELARDFPQNPLFRKELDKLNARLKWKSSRTP